MKLTHVGKIEAEKGTMVLLINSKDQAGVPIYMYVAGRVNRCLKLKEEHDRTGKLDLSGMYVMEQGAGFPPPQSVIDKMNSEFGVRNLSEEEINDVMGPYLAKEENN